MSKPELDDLILEHLKQIGVEYPDFAVIEVLHDNWCRFFAGGTCNCNPLVKSKGKRTKPKKKSGKGGWKKR